MWRSLPEVTQHQDRHAVLPAVSPWRPDLSCPITDSPLARIRPFQFSTRLPMGLTPGSPGLHLVRGQVAPADRRNPRGGLRAVAPDSVAERVGSPQHADV